MSLKLTAVGRLPFGHELRAEWLASLDLTPQKPLRRADERDPQAVEEWLQERCPRLRRRARKHGATIFFLDEAGFSAEPNLGKTSGLKGQTPMVQTTEAAAGE